MYEIDDLFDKKSVVGKRIEQIMENRDCSKLKLSKEIKISRPTIDRILEGTLTNRTTYAKHISKVLKYLDMTPDMLLENSLHLRNKVREIRSIMRCSLEKISKNTGISLERLNQIEAGEEASVAELRDIALSLSISVRQLEGNGYFDTQIGELDDFVQFDNDEKLYGISGFWGHVGILLENNSQYNWYPVTSAVRSLIHNSIDQEQIIIPCMNNKLLWLNMDNVKDIILLDEACDQPGFTNWDSNVSCGEIPLVVYEALEDYLWQADYEQLENTLSTNFITYLDELVEKFKWGENEIDDLINVTSIYYRDGSNNSISIDFDHSETITAEVSVICDFATEAIVAKNIYFTDIGGVEVFLNVKNMSMLEMPLIKVEEKICQEYELFCD